MPVKIYDIKKNVVNDQVESIRNMYFVNGMFLVLIGALLLLNSLLFVPLGWTIFTNAMPLILAVYIYMMIILQASTFLAPYLELYGGEEFSTPAMLAYFVGFMALLAPIVYILSLYYTYNTALCLLTTVILMCNALNMMSKNNREVYATLIVNALYCGLMVLFTIIALMFQLNRLWVCLPIIVVYALDQILKSADRPISWYPIEKKNHLHGCPYCWQASPFSCSLLTCLI
ncbi:putative transporter [Trachipleistophora hominis]|uniref:Putative transporter n=1 Tax=Trachipleistophora hominis TaxID=72359 RepID=L7JV44_TRAHO|nr:putative transporter [Trachipleistophora hominis]